MPRYVVQRTFPEGLQLPPTDEGAAACSSVVARNSDEGVTWIHSYVSEDRMRTFCIYDAPTPEAIRRTAEHNGLPVDEITRVSVLDPYFHH
jgi:Nickel responsive protein SCO4226-like